MRDVPQLRDPARFDASGWPIWSIDFRTSSVVVNSSAWPSPAIAAEPELILADEPTANLDDASAERVGELLLVQVSAGREVILATHDRRRIGPRDLVFDVSDGRLHAARAQHPVASLRGL